MRSILGWRSGLFLVLAALSACGGGGGGSGSSSSSSGGTPPPVRTLFVATQPSGAAPSVAFATQPVVQVRSNGVTDAADNTTVVTVAIVSGTGAAGAALTGTTTATAVAGVATFTNLGINMAGTGYQLRFTATNVSEATSSTFAITAPAVRTLAVATQPQGAAPAATLSVQPAIQVRSNGVLDAADNTTVVTASIAAGTGTAGACVGCSGTGRATGPSNCPKSWRNWLNLAGLSSAPSPRIRQRADVRKGCDGRSCRAQPGFLTRQLDATSAE